MVGRSNPEEMQSERVGELRLGGGDSSGGDGSDQPCDVIRHDAWYC